MLEDRLKQLGGQYLLRTREELALLRARLPEARDGKAQALQQVLHHAHRISGSGALLGFKVISDAMAQVERILRRADPAPDDAEWRQIMEHLHSVEADLASHPPS